MTQPTLKTRRSFRSQLRRAIPVIVVIAVAVRILQRGPWLSPFEAAAIDSLLLLRSPHTSNDIFIVTINEEDYEQLFAAQSPLDPTKLHILLDAIASGKPALIGVDLDTGDPQFKDFQLGSGWPPIVWGENLIYRADRDVFSPVPPLGGRIPEPLAGIAGIPRDSDGLIRRYRRMFPTVLGDVRSFALQLCQSYRAWAGRCDPDGDPDQVILDFSGGHSKFRILSAANVVAASKGAAWQKSDGPIADKIVLLGGSFRAGRDEYATPAGLMSGVELTALMLDSELHHSGVRMVNELYLDLIELVVAIAIVWIHWRLSLGWALFISLLAIPVTAFAAIAFSFWSLAYWVNVVPLALAVTIHSLYDQAQHYREICRELNERT